MEPASWMFWVIAAAVLGFVGYMAWGRNTPPPAPTSVPDPVAVPPPPEIQPRLYGNIPMVPGEEIDLVDFDLNIHDFPDMPEPVTRFEDFNRRLFVLDVSKGQGGVWPDTIEDDFPTRITGLSMAEAAKQIRLRLRPRYPVIYDTYGYWAGASRQLEQDPEFTNEVVETYLAIPEDRRPVVVSLSTPLENGYLTLLRYGFKDFSVFMSNMRFYVQPCLALIFERLIGPREGWLWFSVARMRQAVTRAAQEKEAQRQANSGIEYLEQQAIRAKAEQQSLNRFVHLWQHRIEPQRQLQAPDQVAPATAEGME